MPTRNVSLTPEQDAFIDEVLEAGEYRNASEAVRDAIRALQQRRAEDALKLERLRLLIAQGVDEIERGNYDEVSTGTWTRISTASPRRNGEPVWCDTGFPLSPRPISRRS